jgi:hypothetical protein
MGSRPPQQWFTFSTKWKVNLAALSYDKPNEGECIETPSVRFTVLRSMIESRSHLHASPKFNDASRRDQDVVGGGRSRRPSRLLR